MTIEVMSSGICRIEGKEYPAIGFGTYPFKGETCEKAVTDAARLGYRIIDTATFYENFHPIGKALEKVARQNFYIISKVWPNAQTPQGLQEDLKVTLEQLKTTYIDAYLLHWPNSKLPIEETLRAMDQLRTQGLIRHIGLSNVTVNHLKRVLEIKVLIAWVQVEMNPLFYDPELLEFCHKHSITVQAWAPLGRGRLSQDTLLNKLGEKYEKTSSQVALNWILQHGCIPLPGSKNEEHMQQNLRAVDFELSEDDLDKINQRAKQGKRERITPEMRLGFSDEFDFSYKECWPNQ